MKNEDLTPTIKVLFLLIVGFISLHGCMDESEWYKHPDNPVLPELPKTAWDQWKSDPFVLFEDDIYKMWYGVSQNGSLSQIGYAVSDNGVNWMIHPEPVVLLGPPGSWDDEDVETPTVVKVGATYHLWYCGRGEPEGSPWSDEATYRIGHATSADGINWVKDPNNPVIPLGNQDTNEWDWAATAEPSVIADKGMFKMWYVGGNIIDNKFYLQIGYATSYDGSDWTKFNDNPVLSSLEYNGITTPSIIHSNIGYELWYTIFNEQKGLPSGPFKYAFSKDGIHWAINPGTILDTGTFKKWDSSGIFGPSVLWINNEYKLWYSGFRKNIDFTVNFGIGYANSQTVPGE